MVLDTSIHRSKPEKSLAEISEEKEKPEIQTILTFLEGSGKPITIDKPLIRIGKESSCDIKMKGLFMGKAAGMNAYLTKPMRKDTLMATLIKYIKKNTPPENQ